MQSIPWNEGRKASHKSSYHPPNILRPAFSSATTFLQLMIIWFAERPCKSQKMQCFPSSKHHTVIQILHYQITHFCRIFESFDLRTFCPAPLEKGPPCTSLDFTTNHIPTRGSVRPFSHHYSIPGMYQEIHPYRAICICSYKINTFPLMMRE